MTGVIALLDANSEFTVHLIAQRCCIDVLMGPYSGVDKHYVLLTNLSNASPDATWNSHKPELAISPPFLTRRP
jgi:hypothetical protein